MKPHNHRCRPPLVLATILSVGTLFCYARYRAESDPVEAALAAKPGISDLDLSRPGVATAHIPKSPGAHPHGVWFYLDVGARPDRPDPLAGLRGEVRVYDSAGVERATFPLEEGRTPVSEGQRLYSVARADAVPEGGYTLVVAVEAGAPALAGVRANVFGRYEVCEMEVVPGLLWGLGGCLVGVPAGLLWLAVGARFLWGWVRANRHPQPAGGDGQPGGRG